MSKTDKVKVTAKCTVSSGEDCRGESSGISAEEFFSNDYWERRCHQAEKELQEIARHLEHVNGILNERESVIVSLEHDNRILQAQLDMVHLIFGHRGQGGSMETTKKSKNIECNVLFGDGTSRRVLITSGAVDLVKRAAMVMPFLFEGTGINPLSAEVSNIVAISRVDHAILHRGESVLSSEKTQAIFRLGQMDMQARIADMLTDLADGTHGDVCATLIDAAQRVRNLGVAHGDS